MAFLTITNNGQQIIETNYWQSFYAQSRMMFLTLNAGAFRLLVPHELESYITEFHTAKDVIISRGDWVQAKRPNAVEVLFDDHTITPFAVTLCSGQIDRLPVSSDVGKEYVFTAWVWREKPVCVYRNDCFYRTVARIPYLKPILRKAG